MFTRCPSHLAAWCLSLYWRSLAPHQRLATTLSSSPPHPARGQLLLLNISPHSHQHLHIFSSSEVSNYAEQLPTSPSTRSTIAPQYFNLILISIFISSHHHRLATTLSSSPPHLIQHYKVNYINLIPISIFVVYLHKLLLITG